MVRTGQNPGGKLRVEQTPPYPVEAPDLIELVRRERDPKFRIIVPGTLRNPHPVIARTSDGFATGIWPDFAERLDLSVDKGSVPRALQLMNVLFLALEERGWPVEVHPRLASRVYERSRVRCSILGSEFGFRLREKSRVVKASAEEHAKPLSVNTVSHERTGIFELRIVNPRGFADRIVRDWKRASLEERLNDFIIELLVEVEKDRRFREAEERCAEEQRIAEERRRARERLEQLERDRIAEFESLADRWAKTARLRAFLDALKAEAVRRQVDLDSEPGFARWLEWAERHVRSVDPLTLEPSPSPAWSREGDS